MLRNIADITGQIALNGLDSALIPLFKKGRVLFLVDGLDEIHDDASRSIFVENLEKFLDEYKDTRLIVTSREAGFNLVAPSLARFCDRCNDALRRLAENPLLLTMLLVVKHGAGRLPPDRVSLYGRAVEVLLDTWNIKGHEALNLKEAIPQLACIAFQLMRDGKQTATENELLNLLEEARDKLPQIRRYAKDTAYEFLKRVELRSSLLLEAGHQLEAGRTVPFYQFRHLTFQEYLAAVAVAEGHYLEFNSNDTVLTPLRLCLTSAEWKEVIPMTAVLAKKQAEPLMIKLVTEGNTLRSKLEAGEKFSGKKEWLDYPYQLPAPVARLMQCLVEEAEATPNTLTEALQLLALFSKGCNTPDDWTALCRGPYGEELLHQMWVLYESMNWPIETQLIFSYGQFVRLQQLPGYWHSAGGQTELQRLLTSQIKSEIVHGLFACAGIAWESPENMIDVNLVSLDQVVRLLFDDTPAIRAAAVYAFAVITVNMEQKKPPSSMILDHLLILWLDNNCILEEPLSATLSNLLGLPRQAWKPILSDSQVERIRRLAKLEPEPNVSSYLLSACIMIAFHAKNVWSEDELVNNLIVLRQNRAFLTSKDPVLIIDDMLKQMGEVGRKYLISDKE